MALPHTKPKILHLGKPTLCTLHLYPAGLVRWYQGRKNSVVICVSPGRLRIDGHIDCIMFLIDHCELKFSIVKI